MSGAHTYRPGRYDVKGVEEPTIKHVNPQKAPQELAERVGGDLTEEVKGEETAAAEVKETRSQSRLRLSELPEFTLYEYVSLMSH